MIKAIASFILWRGNNLRESFAGLLVLELELHQLALVLLFLADFEDCQLHVFFPVGEGLELGSGKKHCLVDNDLGSLVLQEKVENLALFRVLLKSDDHSFLKSAFSSSELDQLELP